MNKELMLSVLERLQSKGFTREESNKLISDVVEAI